MTSTMRSNLDEKTQKTIADYVGDIVAMENHAEAELDRQRSMGKDNTAYQSAISGFHDAVRDSRNRARDYQETVGSTIAKPVVEKGAELLGAAVGMVQKVRPEGLSKVFRDNYTTFNALAISYTMLHTTSMALGDKETESFAAKGLETYARLVQSINQTIPQIVVDELMNDGHQITNQNAAAECRMAIDRIWKSAS